MDLESARAKRWWYTGRRIASIARAKTFVDDVGVALLFPARGLDAPSLWAAAADRTVDEFWEQGWGEDMERIWGWKDELPLRSMAWYGKFIRGRGTFLSIEMLRALYPRAGRADDFIAAGLSTDARRIAEVLLPSGPTSAAALREAVDLGGKRGASAFGRAVTELGKALVVTNHGVEEQGSGWPSAVLELTARAFDVRSKRAPERRREEAARIFLDTMIETTPVALGRACGWSTADARAALDAVLKAGYGRAEGKVVRRIEGKTR